MMSSIFWLLPLTLPESLHSLDSGKVWVEVECSLEIVAGSVIFIQIGKRPAGQHVGVSTMLRIGYFLNSGYALALGRRA